MTPQQLRQLTELAEARRSRDLAELEAVVAEDRRLAQAIEGYSRSHAQDMADADGGLPFAQMALRIEWADRNIALARMRRAELAKRISELRKRAAVSLGKHRALEKLTDRAVRQETEIQRAREEKEAPTARHPSED